MHSNRNGETWIFNILGEPADESVLIEAQRRRLYGDRANAGSLRGDAVHKQHTCSGADDIGGSRRRRSK